jgi:hypothetical protein
LFLVEGTSLPVLDPPWPVVHGQKERVSMLQNEEERADWERLSVPVPPGLARAIGYRGEARWVALHWEPCGDESFYDDGRSSGTGSPWAYLAFVRHPVVAPVIAPYDLGSSDSEARECLVLDRGEKVLYVVPIRSARQFLVQQHPPPPELTAVHLADVLDEFSREWQERRLEVSAADITQAMREENQAIEAIVRFLDAHRK